MHWAEPVKYDNVESNRIRKFVSAFLGPDFAYPVVLVSLWKTETTDRDLHFLANLDNLKFLELGHTLVTNESLKSISNVSSLKSVGLNNVKLVDDEGIAFLSNLKNLDHLALVFPGVGDIGIKSVA